MDKEGTLPACCPCGGDLHWYWHGKSHGAECTRCSATYGLLEAWELDRRKNERLEFFKLAGPYGAFSNFSRHPVTFAGRTWPTSEHAYQAMKFHDPAIQDRILIAASPSAAARIGRDRSLPLRADWELPDPTPEPPAIERVKDRVMFDVVLAKFQQHEELKSLLFKAGRQYIVEDTSTTGDAYWGETSPGVGVNRLGHILMAVRAAFVRQALDELTRLTAACGGYDE